jgi:(1->4)-alpha-D-glucan 1-alpha-D-glucosylmutase
LIDERHDGRIKLYVTSTALKYRRDHPALFAGGAHLPLETEGDNKDHVFAFARLHRDETAIAIVPRLVAGLTRDAFTPPLGPAVWGQTRVILPADAAVTYRNVLTGEVVTSRHDGDVPSVLMAEVMNELPIALLEPRAAD